LRLRSGLCGAIFEIVDWSTMLSSAPQLIYAGVLAGGLAFAFQAIGQQHTAPSHAAILLSAEVLFAALFGRWLLGEELTYRGLTGCALIFFSIIAVQVVSGWPVRS
jgi:drug/metabolite transporter (DMT)-like permease